MQLISYCIMLHIVRDIEKFESFINVDAAPNENNLIDFSRNRQKGSQVKGGICVTGS